MHRIPETDWIVFKKLQPLALNRYSAETLRLIQEISDTPSKAPHEKYLEIYPLVHVRNQEVARIFDGFSRSRARGQILAMKYAELLTEGELLELSEETRDRLDFASDS